MIKNLVKHGNSWALVIDRPILELLKMNPEAPVEISTDWQSMTIKSLTLDTRSTRVQAVRKKINVKHAAAFKKLAE